MGRGQHPESLAPPLSLLSSPAPTPSTSSSLSSQTSPSPEPSQTFARPEASDEEIDIEKVFFPAGFPEDQQQIVIDQLKQRGKEDRAKRVVEKGTRREGGREIKRGEPNPVQGQIPFKKAVIEPPPPIIVKIDPAAAVQAYAVSQPVALTLKANLNPKPNPNSNHNLKPNPNP